MKSNSGNLIDSVSDEAEVDDQAEVTVENAPERFQSDEEEEEEEQIFPVFSSRNLATGSAGARPLEHHPSSAALRSSVTGSAKPR
jgi:hypothetical protein